MMDLGADDGNLFYAQCATLSPRGNCESDEAGQGGQKKASPFAAVLAARGTATLEGQKYHTLQPQFTIKG